MIRKHVMGMRWSSWSWMSLWVGACATLPAGCAGTDSSALERYGKTYYLDGAGNFGFGTREVARGLRQANYNGDVEVYIWTMSFNPLIDQLNVPAARFRASALARRINAYGRKYPENPINIIALSAGTGVATWAVEQLEDDVKVRNLILLGSSLSHDYDLSRALKHMTGKVYVYHSRRDAVLSLVPIVGSIDGKRGIAAAGQVGMNTPPGFEGRVINTAWSEEWTRLGWVGAHTDCTNALFVQNELARYIVEPTAGFEGARHVSTAGSSSSRPTNP